MQVGEGRGQAWLPAASWMTRWNRSLPRIHSACASGGASLPRRPSRPAKDPTTPRTMPGAFRAAAEARRRGSSSPRVQRQALRARRALVGLAHLACARPADAGAPARLELDDPGAAAGFYALRYDNRGMCDSPGINPLTFQDRVADAGAATRVFQTRISFGLDLLLGTVHGSGGGDARERPLRTEHP